MAEPSSTVMPPEFTERGHLVWEQYQREHDVTDLRGKVAAVEPESGRVWIGEDALVAVDTMNAAGLDAPVLLVRIGFDYLDVKSCG